jgi:hypothetical protein
VPGGPRVLLREKSTARNKIIDDEIDRALEKMTKEELNEFYQQIKEDCPCDVPDETVRHLNRYREEKRKECFAKYSKINI